VYRGGKILAGCLAEGATGNKGAGVKQ
jgi:hypothetical protein